MLFLSLDIGTTCSKAQVVDEKGNILFYKARECPLCRRDGVNCADIVAITDTVMSLISEAAEMRHIDSIAVSSFGEAFVLLDTKDAVLSYPMLYTDSRGEEQAERIRSQIPPEYIYGIAGVMPAAMYSVCKLLWIKDNKPEVYAGADKLMLIGDYIGYLLTGKRVIDYGLASRTGLFDIRNKCFSKELTDALGINLSLFSEPAPTGTIVGELLPGVCERLRLPRDCRLVVGAHDQICASLGAGVIAPGQSADGMGTVECITTVFDRIPEDAAVGYMGYPIVPFIDGLYCTYILNMTSGSVINWFRKSVVHGYSGDSADVFTHLEEQGRNPIDLLMLPYFSGSANPYQDVNAKGAFFNLSLDTTDGDMYRAILEGTSMEMRLNLETVRKYGINVESMTATGGGSNSRLWVKIKSDITGLPVRTLRSAEGGLCGLAIIQAKALGVCASYEEAARIYVGYRDEYLPDENTKEFYDIKYHKYIKLYKLTKELC